MSNKMELKHLIQNSELILHFQLYTLLFADPQPAQNSLIDDKSRKNLNQNHYMQEFQ